MTDDHDRLKTITLVSYFSSFRNEGIDMSYRGQEERSRNANLCSYMSLAILIVESYSFEFVSRYLSLTSSADTVYKKILTLFFFVTPISLFTTTKEK